MAKITINIANDGEFCGECFLLSCDHHENEYYCSALQWKIKGLCGPKGYGSARLKRLPECIAAEVKE